MSETPAVLDEERPRSRWTMRRLGTAGAATALSAGLLVGGYGSASAATADTPAPSPSTSSGSGNGTQDDSAGQGTGTEQGTDAAREDCPERGTGEAPGGEGTTGGDTGSVSTRGGSSSSYDV